MATESLTHPHHSFVREVDEEVVELVRAIWLTGNDAQVDRTSDGPGERWHLVAVDHAFAEDLINAVARVDPNGEDAVFESFGTDSWIRYLDEENDNLVISTDLSFSVHRLPTVMTALKTMESRKSPEHSKLHYDPLRPVQRRLDLG